MDPVSVRIVICPNCRVAEADIDLRQNPQVVHCSRCGHDWVERSA